MKRALSLVLLVFTLALITTSGTAWARGGGGRGGGRSGKSARNLRGNKQTVRRLYRERALEENRDAIRRDAREDSR